MLSANGTWQFDEYVSAAGWIDETRLLIASASQLFEFDLDTGDQSFVCALEAENEITRSNDGRADPMGGFWIGTMGINAEPRAGAIYRYYQGALRRLFDKITIPNSICFSPDGKIAYYTDTPKRKIMQVQLDDDGWPMGKPSLLVDLTATGENPDGSVVDATGNIWNAQWGSGRVACYSPSGELVDQVQLPAAHATCPAFAGATSQLFCTSATQGIIDPANTPNGQVFMDEVNAQGQLEHQVIL
ncbi:MAG: SMP-30/gluconolactonase/LRE family protein, partial [Planktomarina sp.]